MLAADGTVGSCDGGFDVAQRGVDPFEGWRPSRFWPRPGLDDLVRAPSIGDAGETLKAIADDGTVWIEAALGEPRDRGCTEAGDTAQLQVNRLSVVGGLDSGDERRLARRPAASLSAGAFAAEIGIVDLDPAAQTLGRITFRHDLLQLVFDLPGWGLRHPKATTQFDAGYALFGLRQLIDRPKP